MVCDKQKPVIPDNSIHHILELVGQKAEDQTSAFRLILEQTIFIGLSHGAFAPNDSINHILVYVASPPTKVRDNRTTKGVNADVTGKNIPTCLIFKYGVLDGMIERRKICVLL